MAMNLKVWARNTEGSRGYGVTENNRKIKTAVNILNYRFATSIFWFCSNLQF